MDDIKKYYLHKDDFSKLHFELQDAKPYLLKNIATATKAHRHSFYQLIWFKGAIISAKRIVKTILNLVT